jgi:putative DNA methylase
MTQAYKKKLIEVAIPLEAINAASAREKSIRHGHPSTLHLWWARRPLAACRAVLFAQLVDDPSSHPDKFPTEESVEAERKRLFNIIEELVKWENSTNEEVLEKARKEIRNSCNGELPPVYDPFSGGGSIPLEAQRLGLPAYGSDLNPVAVMIGKAMIEFPRKFMNQTPVNDGIEKQAFYRNAEGLAADVEFYGDWMRAQAFERVGKYYPKVQLPSGGGEADVIAWFWARTVKCNNPGCSKTTPLLSSFILSSKKGNEAYLNPVVSGDHIRFEVKNTFDNKNLDAKSGYKRGKSAVFECAFCGSPTDRDYVASEGVAGRIGVMQTAIACEGNRKRIYLSADYSRSPSDISIPDIPSLEFEFQPNPRDLWCRNFGLKTPKSLFLPRQLLSLSVFQNLIGEVQDRVYQDASKIFDTADDRGLAEKGSGAKAYSEAVATYLSFAVDRAADSWSTQVTWRSSVQASRSTFARQALPMTWDFVELNPFSSSNGNWSNASVEWVSKALLGMLPAADGDVSQADAQSVKYPGNCVISSDPPYYDNIGYADLSDFFFAWMKPSLKHIYPDIFRVLATPKTDELVAAPYRQGGTGAAEQFFLNGMKSAIKNMHDNSLKELPSTIYYAFKQSEIEKEGVASTGWATFVQAIIEAGFAVVGTWPVRTEKPGRMISWGTNALANSVVMVCRVRPESAEIVTRSDFIRRLKSGLPSAISELQSANVSPADMPQSAIGPGMRIFSSYGAVLEPNDEYMTVKTALQLINAELDEFLNNLHGDFDPETRFAASWFEQNGYGKGEYGAANSLATARGISVDSVKHAGIIESSAGKVRILKRDELEAEWDPNTDSHLTIWECCQYLVKEYEDGGETAAAMLIKKMGYDRAEAVKDLAYYLYDICSNKRQDAKEATSYNALIAGWSDITRLAASIHDTDTKRQASLDL